LEENAAEENGISNRRFSPTFIPPLTGRILHGALREESSGANSARAQNVGTRHSCGAGTDATRVASYNPWVSLYWLVTGKTVGGVSTYPDKDRLSREAASRLYTQGSSWFSSESGKKGAIAVGQLADFVSLTDDYFSVLEGQIKGIESRLKPLVVRSHRREVDPMISRS
jgi:predicted amidohydrolase YtcJ